MRQDDATARWQTASRIGSPAPAGRPTPCLGPHHLRSESGSSYHALPAITGLSLQEIGRRSELRRLATLLMREAAETIDAAGITLASLPQLPAPALRAMLRLPTPIAALLPRLMSRSLGTTPALGSTLQSVKRGERTEIDYLNGEVVALGRTIHRPTPYNEAVVELVHRVEATGTFLTAAQVMAAVKRR